MWGQVVCGAINRTVVLFLLIIFAFSSVMPVFGVESRGPPERLKEKARPFLEIDGGCLC